MAHRRILGIPGSCRVLSVAFAAGAVLTAALFLTGFASPRLAEETAVEVAGQEKPAPASGRRLLSGLLDQSPDGSWILKTGGESKNRATYHIDAAASDPAVLARLSALQGKQVRLQAVELDRKNPWRVKVAATGVEAVEGSPGAINRDCAP